MVEIHQPEIEALIFQRMQSGSFESEEEVLLQALRDAPLPNQKNSPALTGAEIIAAFQRCPVKDFDFEPERVDSPISDPVQF